MRGWSAVLSVVTMTACSSVKLAQRDGCWVRKTERFMIGSKEEVGPCAPPTPKWSDDRLTRVMQECAARADYRWQGHALEAWSRREAMPDRPSEAAVLHDCMGEITRAQLAENEQMKQRLGVVAAERDAMMAERDAVRGQEAEARKQLLASEVEARKQLLASHAKLADYLGQAANKAQAPATATASAKSDSAGTAHTESAHDARTSLAARSSPAQPSQVTVTTTVPPSSPGNDGAPGGRSLRKARATPPAAQACPPATASWMPPLTGPRDPLTPALSPAGGEGGWLSTPTPTSTSTSTWTPTLTPPLAPLVASPMAPPDQTAAAP